MKHFFRKHGLPLLYAFLITAVMMYPYFVKDLLPIEHDTFFHVSRIEQLSRSISEGSFLPAVYPYENNGFGYASPLFYSDVLLIPAALLHLAGISVSICYKLTTAAASFFSVLSMMYLTHRITKKTSASMIAGAAYLFANYHITDLYIRGALGELFALIFLPVVLFGMYAILEEQDYKAWKILCLGLCGLALSHNLTFLMGSVLTALIFFLEIGKVQRESFTAVFKGVFLAFLLTAFYTLPMIEQLASQEFIVDYYAANSSLQTYSMDLWQYFANRTVFGLAGNHLEHDRTMLENIGYFLTFAPLLWFIVKKDQEYAKTFILKILLIGYICMFLPSSLLPWEKMSFLRVMQFPWRFNTLAVVLLSVPAADAVSSLPYRKFMIPAVILLLCIEGACHVYPVLGRTFGISSDMTWQDVADGALCDPYYSAYYVRVELAGGDYLPLHSCDFRGRSTALRNVDNSELNIPYRKEGTSLSFYIDQSAPEHIVMPLTYYKGYRAYRIYNGKKTEAEVSESANGLVIVHTDQPGEYICEYKDTFIRKSCIFLSFTALILLAAEIISERKKALSS